MRRTLAALIAAAVLATATAALPAAAHARAARAASDANQIPPNAPPGYVAYPYGEPLPGPNCYWFRLPAYDGYRNMVGWRTPPVAFCSWLAGYRTWP